MPTQSPSRSDWGSSGLKEVRAMSNQLLTSKFPGNDADPALEATRLPESSYIFLAKLHSLGKATAYGIYKAVTDEGGNEPDAISLPLQSSYRVARQLEDKGLIKTAGVTPLRNGLSKQFYRITDEGVRTLHQEVRRLFNLALSALGDATNAQNLDQ